ncbi:MAG TPA: hypothetical protein VI423_04070 [Paenisporosarcina sp.]|nr:hypothetical protein [Paenisporosarcina sp.]
MRKKRSISCIAAHNGAVTAVIGLLLARCSVLMKQLLHFYLEQGSFGTPTNVTRNCALALIVNRFSHDKATKLNTLKS